jgi:hypothetical protein
LIVGQALGDTVADHSHQRMRGAQVNANSPPVLMGCGRLAGLGNLKQCHE